MTDRWLDRADRALGTLIGSGRWLVLPVSLLLLLQWPLREWVHAYSVEANDLAQWLFALYVSLALTEATRSRSHLAADSFAQRYAGSTRRRIARAAALLCLVPWSLFILVMSWPSVAQSVAQLERFPETYNPFYFIIRASTWLLALLVLLQALLEAARPLPATPTDTPR
jgi:TRAP-type mannitol/chloroaromatic compound transport system permease small subunit